MPEHPVRFNCCIRSKDNQEEADTGALMHFRLCLHVSNILMKTRQLWMEIEGLRGWCGWHAAEFLCLARHFINFRHVSDDNEDTPGRWIGGGRWPGNVGANQAQPAPSQNFLYGGGKEAGNSRKLATLQWGVERGECPAAIPQGPPTSFAYFRKWLRKCII